MCSSLTTLKKKLHWHYCLLQILLGRQILVEKLIALLHVYHVSIHFKFILKLSFIYSFNFTSFSCTSLNQESKLY